MKSRHPANNGKVMLAVWVAPQVRDEARARATQVGESISDWVAGAILAALAETAKPMKVQPVERTCETCRHLHVSVNTEPCASCPGHLGTTLWEPKR